MSLHTPLLAFSTMSRKKKGSSPIADRVETAVLGHGFIGPERDDALDGEEYI